MVLTDFREFVVLSQEAIAGVNRIHAPGGGRRQDVVDVQVALAAEGLANADGLVGQLDMQRVLINGAVDRHCCDPQLTAAAQNSESDFAAVGDQHFADGHPRVQAEAGSYQRRLAGSPGPTGRYDFGEDACGAESTTRMWWNW